MILRAAAAALLVHALPALAQFEGAADLEMSAQQEELHMKMKGKGRLYLSPSAWRMEMDVEMEMALPGLSPPGKGAKGPGTQDVHMIMFGKTAAPGKTWMLNERKKTYAIFEDGEDSGDDASEREGWKVDRLGQDEVAGLSCTKVKAHREGENQSLEACLAKDISGAWLKHLRAEKEWWVAACRRAGVTGFPVRMITRSESGAEKYRFQFVKVERKKLPTSLFEVPAGYKEGDVMTDVMSLTPEQQQQIQEAQRRAADAAKDMSPEQRKQLEEMMKQLQEGGKQ